MPGPPNRLTPGSAWAPLAVPLAFLGCTIFGNLGAFVPDTPGDPVNDFLNLSRPIAMCGDTTVAILPADVAPAVACSRMITSRIFIVNIYPLFGTPRGNFDVTVVFQRKAHQYFVFFLDVYFYFCGLGKNSAL